MRITLGCCLLVLSSATVSLGQDRLLGFESGMIPGKDGRPEVIHVPITTSSCLFNLLNSRIGQRHLGLSDEQRDSVRRIVSEIMQESAIDNAVLGGDLAGNIELREMVEERTQEKLNGELPKVLSQEQSERLFALRLPALVHRDGLVGAMSDPFLGRELGLTEKELETLDTKAQEIEAEISAKLKELRLEAIEKLAAEAPADKRRAVEKFLRSGVDQQVEIGLAAKSHKSVEEN